MSDQLLDKAKQNLRKFWDYESFLEGQQDAIQSVLNGKPALVLFPTGGGKSLCYQVPATVLEGLTVVISPLIALMQDQVEQLNGKNISATYINSTLSRYEVEQRLINARNGMYRLLYCSPERLDTELWKSELPDLNISLIAIDEVHCISEWGHDFRPDYRNIYPALKSIADSTRWIALTATATPEVRDDIIDNLHFEKPLIVSTGFKRPNLKWWVATGPKKKQALIKSVKKAAKTGSGIIYCGTRRNCEEIADLISSQLNIKTAAYHAGIDNAARASVQQAWISGKLPLVTATSAFGMGIDKADCRYVIHYQMPYSLEAYYQQAGRAGRDGKKSYPILLYKPSDAREAQDRINSSYPNRKQLQKVYDALCDSLELAVGSTQEEARLISVDALKKRSKLSYSITGASLKTLKNLQIIEYEEQFVPKAGIKFNGLPERLQNYIHTAENKEKAAFLDLLFRRLGNDSFNDFTYINVRSIQQKLGITKNGVIKGLQVLQDHDHLLQFEMSGERPLVRLVNGRVDTLQVSKSDLEAGCERLMKKLDYMKGYIETEGCRELYLRRYFGEAIRERCGHCDNCLQRNKKNAATFSNEEIEQIKKAVGGDGTLLKTVQQNLQWKTKKMKQVVRYLMREEKIRVEEDKIFWNE